MSSVRLWLIRHAKVDSHQGDQPLAADSLAPVDTTAAVIRAAIGKGETVSFHSTRTQRSQQTADLLRDRIDAGAKDAVPAWGLRNPDLYLLGSRVEMVSTAEAFAAQLDEGAAGPDDVMAHPFFRGFLTAPDRIEYWLTHEAPPGETASEVARRVRHFALSFAIPGARRPHHNAVCVTHSPVLRAVLTKWLGLADPGEPDWVEAIEISLAPTGATARFRAQAIPCDELSG